MKVSFIKYKNDSKSYKMAKGLGMDVFEIDSPELIDKKIEELEKDEYTTIFIPNNLACFSEQIYSKYKSQKHSKRNLIYDVKRSENYRLQNKPQTLYHN